MTRATHSNDDARWQVVANRGEGAFVFAVKTTGIYCRPGCAARTPRRENVVFFANNDDAERSGYRPCKKCRPHAANRIPDAVTQACRLLDREPLKLTELADAVGLSPFHLQRLFKEHIGVSPKAYTAAKRDRRFQNELAGAPTITAALHSAGFESSSRCYENTADILGMAPKQYRRGGAGLTIRRSVSPCELGWMLVAATERGICRIEFGDTPEQLEASLRERFPRADFQESDEEFAAWVASMLALVTEPARACDLPLDIRSTAFQRQVWQALRAIPPGTTATYTDVAKQIGRPTAARAVAQACGSNPVAVIIPCHRVIGADGGLRGFRWGIERKRKLLDREAQVSGSPQESAGSISRQRTGSSQRSPAESR